MTNDKKVWVAPTDAQIEAIRQAFIEKQACWFSAETLREILAAASPSPEEAEAAITPDCETCARAAFEGRYRRDSLDPAVADDFGLFLSGYIAGRASQPEAVGTAGGEPTLRERDMAMMIRRLCSHTCNDKTREQAMDLLCKHGLQGSPLRASTSFAQGEQGHA